MRVELEVVVRRGELREASHRLELAASDRDGRLAMASAHPRLVTTYRSAAKPFQLLPLVERGHAERWGLTDEELAVMAASHAGTEYHVGLVTGILERLGLDASHLACGYHDPYDTDARDRLVASGGPRSALYNNCSGKHAGMLCLALSEGWPVAGYHRADHPVQRLMHRTVAEMSWLETDAVGWAIDGCNVPVWALPLADMARAYARFATADPSGDARERSLARIRNAMARHPVATGGKGRFSSDLMEATRGRLVVKGGAEGLECVALPERGLGLAIKCEDGQARGVAPAVIAALEALEVLDAGELARLEPWRRPLLRNFAGTEVGRIEARVLPVAAVRTS